MSQRAPTVVVTRTSRGADLGPSILQRIFYTDLGLRALGVAALQVLEELMAAFRYEYQSDFAREHYGQGRAEATAQALLTVLQRRGLEPSEAQRARILTCADPGVLERWFDRAFDVSAIEDLFA